MDVDFEVNWPLIIQTLIATVLPLIVGLITTKMTRSVIQAMLLALLSIISAGLTELLASILGSETFDLGTWLVGAIGTFAIAVATHYGLWRPSGASAALLAIGSKPEDSPPPAAAARSASE